MLEQAKYHRRPLLKIEIIGPNKETIKVLLQIVLFFVTHF